MSRTVGWFTAQYPVCIELADAGDPGRLLTAVKEQLRRSPADGVGYGLLRYLSPDPELRRELSRVPSPEVVFNYLGQFDEILGGESLLAVAEEGTGDSRSPPSASASVLSSS